MISISAIIRGADRLGKKYSKAQREVNKGINQNLKLVGIKVQKESRLNAKISPTNSPDRGGLEKSILWRVAGGKCFIFVPDNSMAGKYGYRQHYQIEGRGTGTIRKGARAGWKFIDRAVDDNEPWIKRKLGRSFDTIKRVA